MLARLGGIDRNPAVPFDVELGPAVVASDRPLLLVLGERNAHDEARGEPQSARFPDEEGVEVRAVAVPGVASPDGVPTAPARPRLVVAHGLENIVVKRARLPNGASLALGALLGERLQPSLHRNQSVRLQEPRQPHRGIVKLTVIAHQLVEIALGILLARHRVGDGEGHGGLLRVVQLGVHHPVAVLGLASDARRHRARNLLNGHLLVLVRSRQRDPDPNPAGGCGEIFNREVIREFKRPRLGGSPLR